MEAIVLAGGFGTRLSHILKDIPKPMAPVNGDPFLSYIFEYLLKFKVTHVVLAVGYKAQAIQNYFQVNCKGISITYSTEDTPLGTGGAIKKAMEYCSQEDVFVLNGDTYFDVDLARMKEFHERKGSLLTIAVKPMTNFERYGTVVIKDDKIVRFEEKKPALAGRINGGIYLMKKEVMESAGQGAFSFEKDLLEKTKTELYAFESDGYFIDIGVPEDYNRAQKELVFAQNSINKSEGNR